MFFRLFGRDMPTGFGFFLDQPVADPLRSIYLAEYWTGQLLINADQEFLERALGEGRLAQVLLGELLFYGQISETQKPFVEAHILAHASAIEAAARALLTRPDDPDVLRDLTEPLPQQEVEESPPPPSPFVHHSRSGPGRR